MANTSCVGIDSLDRKWGRTVTTDDWKRLGAKSAVDLTDDDLVILEHFGGAKEADQARARRDLARTAPPPEPPAPVTQSAAAPAAAARDYTIREGESFTEFCERFHDEPTPIGVFHDLFKFAVHMNEKNKERNQQLAALDARIRQLENRPMLKYVGVWRDESSYGEGSLTTHAGGLWLAIVEHTTAAPGVAASGWRLIVKSGDAAR